MLKNIETNNKVIIKKMVQLPIDIAAEVLTCHCNTPGAGCALVSTDDGEFCPFGDTHCTDVTTNMWEEYLNG